jgi:hypothetical protein
MQRDMTKLIISFLSFYNLNNNVAGWRGIDTENPRK